MYYHDAPLTLEQSTASHHAAARVQRLRQCVARFRESAEEPDMIIVTCPSHGHGGCSRKCLFFAFRSIQRSWFPPWFHHQLVHESVVPLGP